MKASEMTNEMLAHNLEATIPFLMKEARHLTDADEIMTEAATRLRKQDCKKCEISKSEMRFRYERDAFEKKCNEKYIAQGKVMADTARQNVTLRVKLKVAEDALKAASDAFRFCIEQCELELGPKMIGKLCDDGKAVERAIAAIREEGGAK